MSVDPKAARKKVIFALAILKPGVILDRAESSRIEAALHLLFPGVSIILVDENDRLAKCPSRHKLSAFIRQAPCSVFLSSKITAN